MHQTHKTKFHGLIILRRKGIKTGPYKTTYSFSIYPKINISSDDWLRKGAKITVTIKDVDDKGNGIAHVHGVKIIVPKASIGDKVKVVVEKVKGDIGYAKIIEWVS